jgi:hypothetical protein
MIGHYAQACHRFFDVDDMIGKLRYHVSMLKFKTRCNVLVKKPLPNSC